MAAVLAKAMAMICVRNTMLKDLHAGKVPVTRTGDFSDVFVVDAEGNRLPWKEVSRFDDDEMRDLMRQVVTHTGELGAVWMFQDPEDRIPNNPGITVDFRALGLAAGGLDHAERHFRQVMEALAIPYGEHQLRLSRVDFAVDLLAPWFEPERIALVAPPGTKVTEYTGPDETVTQATGSRVTGLRAGNVDNRQLAIYDKRGEVMQKAKDGWLAIWNAERASCGQDPLDLSDRLTSQVWRFEPRLGPRQLRGRFVTRAAISDVQPGKFYAFMDQHTDALRRYSEEHPRTLEERLQKAGGKYRWE